MTEVIEKPIDFATFLNIVKEEEESGDALTEVIKALKGLDRYFMKKRKIWKNLGPVRELFQRRSSGLFYPLSERE